MYKKHFLLIILLFLTACQEPKTIDTTMENKVITTSFTPKNDSGENQKKDPHQNDNRTYNNFIELFKEFRKEFVPNNFENISPSVLVFKTVSYPKNSIREKITDNLYENKMSPTRVEQYYQSENSDLLVKVNFIYNSQLNEKDIIGLNEIKPSIDENIRENKKTIGEFGFSEYILTFKNMLVIINFIDPTYNVSLKDLDEDDKFIKESNEFLKVFELIFLPLEKKYK